MYHTNPTSTLALAIILGLIFISLAVMTAKSLLAEVGYGHSDVEPRAVGTALAGYAATIAIMMALSA